MVEIFACCAAASIVFWGFRDLHLSSLAPHTAAWLGAGAGTGVWSGYVWLDEWAKPDQTSRPDGVAGSKGRPVPPRPPWRPTGSMPRRPHRLATPEAFRKRFNLSETERIPPVDAVNYKSSCWMWTAIIYCAGCEPLLEQLTNKESDHPLIQAFSPIFTKIKEGNGEAVTQEEVRTAYEAIWPVMLKKEKANASRRWNDTNEAVGILLEAVPNSEEHFFANQVEHWVYERPTVCRLTDPTVIEWYKRERIVRTLSQEPVAGTRVETQTDPAEMRTLVLLLGSRSVGEAIQELLTDHSQRDFLAEYKGRYFAVSGERAVTRRLASAPPYLSVQIARMNSDGRYLRTPMKVDQELTVPGRHFADGEERTYKPVVVTHFSGAHHNAQMQYEERWWKMDDIAGTRLLGEKTPANNCAYLVMYKLCS